MAKKIYIANLPDKLKSEILQINVSRVIEFRGNSYFTEI
mgnify:CR=1 FL=1